MNVNMQIRRLSASAVCLALCMVLPLLTGQIKQIGNMLCPMHFPVLLCGFFCGPVWAAAVGAIAPILRHFTFGMPPFPSAFAMCFELLTYGLVSGALYRLLPKKKSSIYFSLFLAMLLGRIVSGTAMALLMAGQYTWKAFFAANFVNAVPGILLQIILLPILVMALNKANMMRE